MSSFFIFGRSFWFLLFYTLQNIQLTFLFFIQKVHFQLCILASSEALRLCSSFFFFLNYFIYLNKEGMVANSLKHKLSEATCGLLDALWLGRYVSCHCYEWTVHWCTLHLPMSSSSNGTSFCHTNGWRVSWLVQNPSTCVTYQ